MKYLFWSILPILFLLWPSVEIIKATEICPENSPALTPSPLEAEWAIEWWMPRHEEKLQEKGRESANLLFLGDSITHGWETTGAEVFHQYFTDYNVYNIGFSGDRTENVLWRLLNGEVDGINPEAAVLMIGTNNTGHRQDVPECTSAGIEMILDQINERLPETHILLLAIFPRGKSHDDELRQLNHQINQRIEKFGEREMVTFLDVNHVFLNDNGVLSEEIMPDMLHPNEYGYKLWAQAIEPVLKQLLED